MQAVTNVRCIMCDMFFCVQVMLNQGFIQHDFNPEDIPFSRLPSMSEAVLQTMLPDKEGNVFPANLHEGLTI